MSSDFAPENELERQLVRAQQGGISLPQLLESFVASQVVALFDQDPATVAQPQPSPLVISNSTGVPSLAVFTSLDRATPWTKKQPEFQFALLVDFGWLLKGIAPGVGLVVNPSWPVGFELSAAGVQQFRADFLPNRKNLAHD